MGRTVIRITREMGVPLMGSVAFGLIDRGTNLIQVRPTSTCAFSCIFCSTDAGPRSRTRQTEYVVDLEYLMEWFTWVIGEKDVSDAEAHIDTVGDPFTYPQVVELVRKLRELAEVRVISSQTHGPLLTEDLISRLERAGMDRINLSIDSLNEEKARYISGSPWLRLNRVLRAAELIAASSMDLLIAPVWVPGVNDEDMPQLIEFALRIGAGKKWPPLGIQKYEAYRGGRRPKGIRPMSWSKFYTRLREWEEEYGVKLVLRPEDFGIRKARRVRKPMRKGQVITAKVVSPGWRRGEVLGQARGRVVTILDAPPVPLGSELRVRIIRDRDNVYYARFLAS